MQLAQATLVLSLLRIVPLVSPLLSVVHPHVANAAAQGGLRTQTAAGATAVPATAAAAQVHIINSRRICARGRENPTGNFRDEYSYVLYAAGQDGGRESDRGMVYAGDEPDQTPPTDSTSVQHQHLREQQQSSSPPDGVERETAAPSRSSNLDAVVAQLRGDIEAGSTPQVRSRVKLDSLFAELRGLPLNSTTLLTAPTTPDRQAGPTRAAVSRELNGTLAKSDTKDRLMPSPTISNGGAAVAAGGGEDLESLSDMLARLQANAKARDLAKADARAAAMRSGGPVGDGFSTATASKHKQLLTRFADIRDGRVSWAVLPLILRARKAGIPLSTGVYNAAIGAYVSTPRKYADAMEVLDLLKRSGDPDVRPDLASYNLALRVCGEAGKWRVAFELLKEMEEEGIEPDTMSYNCALNGLAKCREWYRARRLFRKMGRDGLSRDVYSHNGLVEAAGMGSLSPRRNMIQIVYDMEQAGVEPTAYTYTLLLDCLAQRSKAFDGFQVMARLVDARVPLLPVGYRAGLLFCKEYGDWRRAMVLMEDMRVAERRPSGLMYLLAVQACAKGGQWERALSLMVERRTTVAREAKQKRDGRPKPRLESVDDPAPAEKRASELDVKTLEAVLSAVSEAGQFEVAIRLVQQLRSAGHTPSKKCYLYTLRAASKWGRWDVIEGLLKDMRALGVGVMEPLTGAGIREQGIGNVSTMLSSDCYPSLVEAYAQASMWERTIEAYEEGFVFGRQAVEAINYRVYESVLKACVGANDGAMALEVIRRQAAEPRALQDEALAFSAGTGDGEASGGPPDRRCWCLAAEALGRTGMVKEGHAVLRAMVNSGIPVRNSTKTDVPSLMPLPSAPDGFDWHQRRRRRSRRRTGPERLSSPAFSVGGREAAVRLLLDSASGTDPPPEAYRKGAHQIQGLVDDEEGAAIGAGGGRQYEEEGKRGLGLGWLLVSDWQFKNSEMEREARGGGILALERKRRRMSEFSRKTRERLQKVDAARSRAGGGGEGGGGGVVREEEEDCSSVAVGELSRVGAAEAAQLDLRPGGRRGRNEALTLRIRVRHTPGVLGRGTRSARRDRGYLVEGAGGEDIK